jgi:cytochrome c biogenesis protein CcdA
MVGAVIPVASLALADAINPVTILVAAYLASRSDPRPRLAGFVLGVFFVYLLGGLLLLLGPGELLHVTLRGRESRGFHIASVVLGVSAISAAAFLWIRRSTWGRARLPDRALQPGSALVLGAVVTAIDLPTAFPYFAAIGVTASSGASLAGQVLLLVLFNALYVLPLAVMLVAHLLLGARFEPFAVRLRIAVDRLAVPLVVGITVAVGLALAASGVRGLLG